MSAPAYSFRRGKTGHAKSARLTRDLVRDIRKWAAREGAIFTQMDQVRLLQEHYPLGTSTLKNILANTTWHDPTYTPGEVDRDYYSGARSMFLLTLVRAVVSNATRN